MQRMLERSISRFAARYQCWPPFLFVSPSVAARTPKVLWPAVMVMVDPALAGEAFYLKEIPRG